MFSCFNHVYLSQHCPRSVPNRIRIPGRRQSQVDAASPEPQLGSRGQRGESPAGGQSLDVFSLSLVEKKTIHL
jgi:hypothetical protein